MSQTTENEANGSVDKRDLTPPYFRYLVRIIRPFPDFDFFFVKSLRQKAVQLLQLRPGDSALDVGCGPGGSFPYLVEAVGPAGKVAGLEISPGVAINARRRIENNRWSNVSVIEGDARTAVLPDRFDGMLMFAAPDTYASPQALDNLWPSLKDNARVVAFGAKLSSHRLARLMNPLFRWWFSSATFSSTPKLDYAPWALLAGRVNKLQVQEYFLGWMFLAWGVRKATGIVISEGAKLGERH